MKTIAIMNLKGGVGKTSLAVNMAYILAQHHGQRVLVIDADGQRNATTSLVDECELGEEGLSDFLRGDADPIFWPDIVRPSRYRGIDVLPGDAGLYDPRLEAYGNNRLAQLRNVLIEDDAFDYVIIDCPPGFPPPAINAAVAANVVIIPTTLDAYGFAGAADLVYQIDLLRQVSPSVRVGGILLTRPVRTPETKQQEAELRGDGRFHVYNTVVSNSDRVPASTFARCPVVVMSPKSWATTAYKRFVREFLDREEALHNG